MFRIECLLRSKAVLLAPSQFITSLGCDQTGMSGIWESGVLGAYHCWACPPPQRCVGCVSGYPGPPCCLPGPEPRGHSEPARPFPCPSRPGDHQVWPPGGRSPCPSTPTAGPRTLAFTQVIRFKMMSQFGRALYCQKLRNYHHPGVATSIAKLLHRMGAEARPQSNRFTY